MDTLFTSPLHANPAKAAPAPPPPPHPRIPRSAALPGHLRLGGPGRDPLDDVLYHGGGEAAGGVWGAVRGWGGVLGGAGLGGVDCGGEGGGEIWRGVWGVGGEAWGEVWGGVWEGR